MCRNLFFTGVKADKQAELQAMMAAAAPFLTDGNDDGVGYAAMGANGIVGERWLQVDEAFKTQWTSPYNPTTAMLREHFKDSLIIEGSYSYNHFKERNNGHDAPFTSVIMHARMATCAISIENTHPFYREGTAMTHNGTIQNHDKLSKLYSTCDSEVILNSYVDNEVNKDPTNVQKVADSLRGAYAVGFLSTDNEGRQILDVFKNGPSLNMCHVKELDAIVICTSTTVIDAVLEKLNWSRGEMMVVRREMLIRFDAVTGEFLLKQEFKEATGHTGGGNNTSQGNSHIPDYRLPTYHGALVGTSAKQRELEYLRAIKNENLVTM